MAILFSVCFAFFLCGAYILDKLNNNIVLSVDDDENYELRQLLKKLKDYIVHQNPYKFYGMCGEINEMYKLDFINDYELDILYDFIKTNTPTNFDEDYGYWWNVGEKQPRIDWLDEQISKL